MKKYYLSAGFVLISILAFAQQRPQYSQYMINPFLLNPAVSGTEDYADIRAGYRKQWTGFDGSPRTMYLTAHTAIGKNQVVNNRSRYKKNGFHGVGMAFTNDAIGATSNTTMDVAYSYHMKLSKKVFASLGVMGGLQQFSLDAGKLNTTVSGDPLVTSFTNTSLADINTGFWIYSDKFYMGGSMVQLMSQKLYNQNGVESNGRLAQHFFLMAGYRIPMGYDFTFIPSVCLKAVSPAPLSFDINAKIRYRDQLWAGVSYRNKDAVAFMVGVIVNNTFDISYSYDYTTSNIRKYSGGSHEIIVGYRLRPKGSVICPSKYW